MAWLLRVLEGVVYGLVMGSILYGEVWAVAWGVDIQGPPLWSWVMVCAVCRAIYVRSENASRTGERRGGVGG